MSVGDRPGHAYLRAGGVGEGQHLEVVDQTGDERQADTDRDRLLGQGVRGTEFVDVTQVRRGRLVRGVDLVGARADYLIMYGGGAVRGDLCAGWVVVLGTPS